MGAFITCWLPFFIIALIKPICAKCEIPRWLDSLALWLGYLNSTINPVLYATFNRDFRVPFREILCCRCLRLKATLRNETYAEIYGEVEKFVVTRNSDPILSGGGIGSEPSTRMLIISPKENSTVVTGFYNFDALN